jgi:predicted secreted protein
MRELGLALGITLLMAASACQSSEPARTNPPSSATNPGTSTLPHAGPDPAPAGDPRIYDDKVTSIEAGPNGSFTIALPANVSTPLEWKLEPEPNPAILALSGRKYTDSPPAGCQACTGYPGTDAFTFVAKGPGEAVLHFVYRELRKDAPPAREITVQVRVGS